MNAAGHLLARVEARYSGLFGAAHNPFHHLGALGVYFFWIALVSGIYLLVFYETSLSGAWASVERMTHAQWYAGGIMRSLHRYASDAAVLAMLGHLLRELLRGRFRGPRWFSWFTGVGLIWIVIILGITGYWMVWDELAQYIAVSTARLADALPVFTDPMSRNFLSNDSVSDRLFTLIAFIHLVGLPIILVIGLWFHLLRIRLPRINPPRVLMAGGLAALLALSLLTPALSHGPADLGRVPEALAIDWFYLAVFPLQAVTSEGAVWTMLGGGTLLLAAVPWLWPGHKPAPAQVHLPDCTGCGFCAEDCPYGAIDMVPRTDGRRFDLQALVDPDLCVGCGICTGSCPSSSPFRRQVPLTSGIELSELSMDTIMRSLKAPEPTDGPTLLVVGCVHGAPLDRVLRPGMARLDLPCAGMFPPSAIDYALHAAGFDGVVISGCDTGDCMHRYGDRWLRERITRERLPMLRGRVPRGRVLLSWNKAIGERTLRQDIEAFGRRLAAPPGVSPEGAA